MFTETLPSNGRRYADCWEGIMLYAVEMRSGAMIYIPSFIKIGLGLRNLIMGVTLADTQRGNLISLLSLV
jgi:hypothetical protein